MRQRERERASERKPQQKKIYIEAKIHHYREPQCAHTERHTRTNKHTVRALNARAHQQVAYFHCFYMVLV